MRLDSSLEVWSLPVILRANRFPPGDPPLFVPVGTSSTITVPSEIITTLTADQQTFFTGSEWANFYAFYADISRESWFVSSNIIGSYRKGVAIYPATVEQEILDVGLVWFGYDIETQPVTIVEWSPLVDSEGAELGYPAGDWVDGERYTGQ